MTGASSGRGRSNGGSGPHLPPLARLYLTANQLRQKVFTFTHAVFNGFWLGLLSHEAVTTMSDYYYTGKGAPRRPHEPDFSADDYNQRGLAPWEEQAIRNHFPESGRLLVLGAGGGREVIALQRAGYLVDGFECSAVLVDCANDLLDRLGLRPTVFMSPPDGAPSEPPAGPAGYDGIIVGWGTYTQIRGRDRRIALLRQLHRHVGTGRPILLSFWAHQRHPPRLRVTAAVAQFVSRLRFGERIEIGDDMSTVFVHYFTEEEIFSELANAGFELVHFSMRDYGHAIGRATALLSPSSRS